MEWTLWAGRAALMARDGSCVVCPGVAVRLVGGEFVDGKLVGGEHVAYAEGGYEDTVDKLSVVESVRAALVEWPETVSRIEIHVEKRPKNKYTRRGRALRGLPS